VGPFNKAELSVLERFGEIRVAPGIAETEDNLYATGPTDKMETVIALLYHFMMNSKQTEEGYQQTVHDMEQEVKGRQRNAPSKWDSLRTVFGAKVESSITPEVYTVLDLSKTKSLYKRFAKGEGFTFMVVGDFKMVDAIPLIAKYLGNLPGTMDKKSTFRNRNYHSLELTSKKRTAKVIDSFQTEAIRAKVGIDFVGHCKETFKNQLHLNLLRAALEIRLTEVLSRNTGLTYVVGVAASTNAMDRFELSCGFECDVNLAEKACALSLKEVQNLYKKSVDTEFLNLVKAKTIRGMDNDAKNRDFWLDYLANRIRNDQSVSSIADGVTIVNSISEKDLRRIAKKHLSKAGYFQWLGFPLENTGGK
jgi:zinc protease